ncbi:intraciliary transport [Trichomonas vaginalis G3]|nr:intraciliary transport [Trichomonas vaginalis G3]KAI5549320.1 intraciliary transport [Trichomonas vaginalis G3]
MQLWHGYSLFHSGQYEDAIDIYENLLKSDPDDTTVNLYISSCEFYLQDYEVARDYANKGPSCDYKTRLLFHIAQQTNDDDALYKTHSQLLGTLENQLSLAAIHYIRSHYQEAIDIYTKLLAEHPDYIALNVYIAMCQFKLDQHQEANDTVDQYLQVNSDSAVALNLKSCAYLKLYDPSTAESQLLQIRKFSSATYGFVDSLINHNLCIFHDGDDGFTFLPKLVGIIPQAQQNLAILYLRESNSTEAYNILQDFQPLDLSENLLKATVDFAYGQLTGDANLITSSNEVFKEYGNLDEIKDTIQGRQVLSTNKFIEQEWDAALKVLQSIEEYLKENDEFNYNKAMILAQLSRWAEAERFFLLVKNPAYLRELYYTSWLCMCYIMNRKPEKAWELYTQCTVAEDAKTLLQIISSECYTQGMFYFAMKAYSILAGYEMNEEMKQGMIASAVGVFRNILSRKEEPDKINEIYDCLMQEKDAEQVLQTIQNYVETSGEFDTTQQ